MDAPYLHEPADPRAELLRELHGRTWHPRLYRSFEVPKASGGVRRILAPNADLMRLLRGLLTLLRECRLPGSTHAHAYYVGRSIRTMAEPHLGKATVVKFDLKDFFPSLSRALVLPALHRAAVPGSLVALVSKWCFYENGLPIGAPTSPLLSNLTAAHRFDHRLAGLVVGWHRQKQTPEHWRIEDITYTRYADDLVFSSDYPDLPKIIPAVRKILASAGFALNEKKIRVLRRERRQIVCGVVVNVAPGAARPYRRKLIHELYRLGCDVAQLRVRPGVRRDRITPDGFVIETPLDLPRLAGRVAHVKWLKPAHARVPERLFDRLVNLQLPSDLRRSDAASWARSQLEKYPPWTAPAFVPETPKS